VGARIEDEIADVSVGDNVSRAADDVGGSLPALHQWRRLEALAGEHHLVLEQQLHDLAGDE
jgi:hypothetical protein